MATLGSTDVSFSTLLRLKGWDDFFAPLRCQSLM